MADKIYCAECGNEFGAGDEGYQDCEQHQLELFDIFACSQKWADGKGGQAMTIAHGLAKSDAIELGRILAKSKPFGVHFLRLRTPLESGNHE